MFVYFVIYIFISNSQVVHIRWVLVYRTQFPVQIVAGNWYWFSCLWDLCVLPKNLEICPRISHTEAWLPWELDNKLANYFRYRLFLQQHCQCRTQIRLEDVNSNCFWEKKVWQMSLKLYFLGYCSVKKSNSCCILLCFVYLHMHLCELSRKSAEGSGARAANRVVAAWPGSSWAV